MDDYQSELIDEFRAGRVTREELVRRASVLGLSLSALAPFLGRDAFAAPLARTAVTPKRGGTGRFGSIAPGLAVDPLTMNTQAAIYAVQLACEYLAFPRPDYTLEPRLATEWSAGPTPKTWTFTIRQGVRWHDGSPLTVDDVVATFNRITDPAVRSAGLSAFATILSHGNVEKVGRNKVRFHLDRPFVDFPYLVSAFSFNSVILPKNYEVGQFQKGGVGTGPFILKEYQPQQRAVYAKNPRYWNRGLPYLDGIELTYFADQASIVLALQAGRIDVFGNAPVQGSQALFGDPNVTAVASRSSAYRAVDMRVDTPPWNDKRVRQAVAYAIDRRALVQNLLGGLGEVGNDHAFAPIFPSSALARRLPQRTRDLAKARRLLAEAGHSRGFKTTLVLPSLLELPQYAVFLKDQLKDVGIDVELDIRSSAAFFGSGANQPWLVLPFAIVQWAARGTPSQTIPPAFKCEGIWNTPHWCNRQFNIAMDQFDARIRGRAKVAAKAAAIQQDKTPAILAYWLKDVRATRKNVRGLASGPTSHIDASKVWLA